MPIIQVTSYALKLLIADPHLFWLRLNAYRNKPVYTYEGAIPTLNRENSKPLEAIANDFNLYREKYAQLTFEDLKALNTIWYQEFPFQKYFDYPFVLLCTKKLVDLLKKPNLTIMEMGGYQGELAYEILKRFPKTTYRNFEVIKHRKVVGLNEFNYREVVLTQPFWVEKPSLDDCDLFIMSDTIEHFTDEEAQKIIAHLEESGVKSIIIKSPLEKNGQTWQNYHGSHLLTLGSKQLKAVVGKNYRMVKEITETFFWIQKDL